VARTIRVELKKIEDIVQVDHSLSRVEQIAQRKQAIYQYRNQCLMVYLWRKLTAS
jgi:4'-phosphopantetheinyl transferase